MGQSVSECKPCKVADPVTNTVKVDPTLLSGGPLEGLKAQQPQGEDELAQCKEEERHAAEERERLEEARMENEQLQAEQERLRHEAEKAECRKQAEEGRRQAEEEAERHRKEEDELAERLAQEERERELAAAAERAAAEAAALAEAARAASAKAKAEVEAAQKAVDNFLKARGFKNMLTPRKAICGAAMYPLHLAVEENNADTVRALLKCGAEKGQKNSSKMTPLELALKCNKKGSHDAIVELLRA